ncbi:MAG: VacJ family lipoprotein [Burkholderiaceae bacterium]
MRQRWHLRPATALLLGVALSLGACTTLQQARGGPGQKFDPWENWNRKVFAFNEDLDRTVLRPVATAYADVVPQLVRRGVDNFFANAADAWSAINNVLQAKPQPAFEDVVRFTTNTVFGFVGVLDIASEFGLERHNEDFGQTLGHWGMGPGAYVVWPLFGPSTVRDSLALPLDRAASPALVINDGGAQVGITTLQLINARANLLGATRVLDDIALDKYTFLRDAYLQRRGTLQFDGDSSDASDDLYAPSSDQEEAPRAAPGAAAPDASAPASGAAGSSVTTPSPVSGTGPAAPASAAASAAAR